MSLTKLIEKWKSYRFRFVPWIIFNLNKRVKERSTRLTARHSDSLLPKHQLEDTILNFLPKLQKVGSSSAQLFEANKQIMLKHLGFCVDRKESKIPGAGTGVFLVGGQAKKGAVVALYPGTIYRQHEPILLPSLNNSFIFRCLDGTHVDGKDAGLSKIIFKSVAGRDKMGTIDIADISWLTPYPINPWSVGQYINNSSNEFPCNVAYQEFDLPENFSSTLLSLLPYVLYSSGGNRRVVAVVAVTDMPTGTELLSSYYTLVGQDPETGAVSPPSDA